MHHTIVFAENPTLTTLDYIAGVADVTVRVADDDIYIGKYNRIVAAGAIGNSLSYSKLLSPSLRRFFNPFIIPKCSVAADSKDAYQMMDLARNPIPLDSNEALNAQALVSEVHDGEWNMVIVNLAEGALTPITGEIHTMKMTGSGTLTIGVWTSHTLTLTDDLPRGRYALVGAEVYANMAGAFRFIPIEGDNRPGGIMCDDDFYSKVENQRLGKWGTWLEFDNLHPPSLEICPYVAGTWYTCTIDLIKIA